MSVKNCLNGGGREPKPLKNPNLKFLVKAPTVNSVPILPPLTAAVLIPLKLWLRSSSRLSIKEHTNEKTRASKYSEKSILKSSRAFHIFCPVQINRNLI